MCSPGIHLGKKSDIAPARAGIVTVAWRIFIGASVASTSSLIDVPCAEATREATAMAMTRARENRSRRIEPYEWEEGTAAGQNLSRTDVNCQFVGESAD